MSRGSRLPSGAAESAVQSLASSSPHILAHSPTDAAIHLPVLPGVESSLPGGLDASPCPPSIARPFLRWIPLLTKVSLPLSAPGKAPVPLASSIGAHHQSS